MTPISLQALKPTYLPPGYEFRQRRLDEAAEGFRDEPDQVAFIYTQGWEQSDWAYPLIIYLAPPGTTRPVSGTEDHLATNINLDIQATSALYHDGWWSPGPGDEQIVDGDVMIHWDRSDTHSLTVSSDIAVYAIRGMRSHGVTLEELVKVASSIRAA